MPGVCKFWAQGNCRNGNNCRFSHPNSNPNQQPVNGNRFAALDNSSSRDNGGNGYQNRGPPAPTLPYSLDKGAIITDLTSERPQWILSAYGPGRGAPAQLFGGPMREQSFEEMRLLHYMAVAAGNPQQAAQDAEQLFRSSEQQIQNAINNIDAAVNFILAAEKDHPNRLDIVQESQAVGAGSQANPFNNKSGGFQQATNVFGRTGQHSSAFGNPSPPAFGAPTTLGSGGFGQPSTLGQAPRAFGGNPAFGTPAQLGTGGAFGQPSTLGQKPNPFGAASSTAAAAPFSAFAGNPNPFGQKQMDATPFGAPSQPAQSNGFGIPAPATSIPFGASTQPVQANSFPQPFAHNPTPAANPFGTSAPEKNPFGAPAQSQSFSNNTNPFAGNVGGNAPAQAAPNPFTKPVSNLPPNSFNQPQPVAPPASGFGIGAPQPSQLPNRTVSNLELGAKHPEIDTYSTRDSHGRLLTFKGQRVIYKGETPANHMNNQPAAKGIPGFRGPDGVWERIWFPQGPPVCNKDTAMPDSMYDQTIENAYKHARATGTFEGGKMPLLPPKREWCNWEF